MAPGTRPGGVSVQVLPSASEPLEPHTINTTISVPIAAMMPISAPYLRTSSFPDPRRGRDTTPEGTPILRSAFRTSPSARTPRLDRRVIAVLANLLKRRRGTSWWIAGRNPRGQAAGSDSSHSRSSSSGIRSELPGGPNCSAGSLPPSASTEPRRGRTLGAPARRYRRRLRLAGWPFRSWPRGPLVAQTSETDPVERCGSGPRIARNPWRKAAWRVMRRPGSFPATLPYKQGVTSSSPVPPIA
jgi:hypothetical protein